MLSLRNNGTESGLLRWQRADEILIHLKNARKIRIEPCANMRFRVDVALLPRGDFAHRGHQRLFPDIVQKPLETHTLPHSPCTR
jgi:hypothetical protein